jgi:hypothetical protein
MTMIYVDDILEVLEQQTEEILSLQDSLLTGDDGYDFDKGLHRGLCIALRNISEIFKLVEDQAPEDTE